MEEEEGHSEPGDAGCPNCSEHQVEPRAVSYGNGMKTLSFECLTCGHQWDVQSEFPEPERMP